jgi:ribosomal protein S18 acetylase RimI-like enzyme
MSREQERPEIRPAALADCASLARVQVDSYRSAYGSLLPPSWLGQFSYEEQESDWEEQLNSGRDDILLVAVDSEGAVAGYVLARASPDIYPGYDAEVVALHVRQPRQRHRLGSRLLLAALKELERRGCRSVMLWTLLGNPVQRWYERLGGTVLAQKCGPVEGWQVTDVAYGWPSLSELQSALASAGARSLAA